MELQYVPSIYPVYTSIAKAGRGVVSWKGFKSLSSKVINRILLQLFIQVQEDEEGIIK